MLSETMPQLIGLSEKSIDDLPAAGRLSSCVASMA